MSPLSKADREAIENAVENAVLKAFAHHQECDHKPLERLVYAGVGICAVIAICVPLAASFFGGK